MTPTRVSQYRTDPEAKCHALLVEMREIAVAIADDHSDYRALMVVMLQELGYRVVCAAANGAELLEACATKQVDVVLVDLDMPIIDGLEAAEELQEMGVPVVLISGLPESKELVLEEEPVAARLMKPARPEAIQQAIEQALQSRRETSSDGSVE